MREPPPAIYIIRKTKVYYYYYTTTFKQTSKIKYANMINVNYIYMIEDTIIT